MFEKDKANIRKLLSGADFVFGGYTLWANIGIYPRKSQRTTWVYNNQIEGQLTVDRQSFMFIRQPFPRYVTDEWIFVDLINHIRSTDFKVETLCKKFEDKLFNESLQGTINYYANNDTRNYLRDYRGIKKAEGGRYSLGNLTINKILEQRV
jgi:hypothetical protein